MLAQRNDNVRLLNSEMANVQAMFEVERQKKVALDHNRAVRRTQRPWEAPFDELSHDQLAALKGAMSNLQARLVKYIEEKMQEQQQNPLAQPGTSSFRGGGGGGAGALYFMISTFNYIHELHHAPMVPHALVLNVINS